MEIESLLYKVFGNNIVVGPHIRRQLRHLKEMLPPCYLGRHVDDLGCGDGRVTVLLDEVFQPVKLRGFDINPALVRMARTRGVDADVLDLAHEVPRGELAILWGVLHHLDDPGECLRRIRAHYDLVCVREPLKGSSRLSFELGSPLAEEELRALLSNSLPGVEVLAHRDCLLALLDQRAESPGEPVSQPARRDAVMV